MIFNSLIFLVFFCTFLCLYWYSAGRTRLWLCLIGSYFFYGWWNWYFLSLILFSTSIDFFIARRIDLSTSEPLRKRLVTLSVVTNLGLLAFFKYFNFFAESLQVAANRVGWHVDWATLNIILPVGISFYTFQSLSYTIDVYRKKLKHEPDFVRFATFVSFFPQLVAGPIVRAVDFLPQLQSDRKYKWDDTVVGFGQILLGFFKKLVVADSLAPLVDALYSSPDSYSSLNIVLVSTLFAFQVYGDFSGYSDIAIGSARMLGFRLPVNFNFPFFATCTTDFWRRWHISLSTWLKDYLYIPLGGSRYGNFATQRNLFITMTLSGLWHGAAWTYVVWGMIYGVAMMLEREWLRRFRPAFKNRLVLGLLRVGLPVYAVGFLVLSLIIFRSADLSEAWMIYEKIAAMEGFSVNALHNRIPLLKGIAVVGALVLGELICQFVSLKRVFELWPPSRVIAYACLIWAIALLGSFEGKSFVYFQF